MINKKSLFRNILYNGIYKVLNIVFPIISTAYISRILYADGVGRFSAANNNVSYFLILASLGIPVLGLREIARARKKQNRVNKVFSELFIVNALLTIFSLVLYNVLILNLDYFKSDLLLYEILGISILLNIFNIDWLFQGLEEYKYIAVRSSVVKALSVVLLFIFVKQKNDIYVYAIIHVLATTGNYLLNMINCRKYVHFDKHNINLKPYIKPLSYLALCTVSTELYARIDITMLDMMESKEVVGYYANSQKIINLLISVLVSITAVFLPRLNFLYSDSKKEFNKMINFGFELMVTLSIPISLAMIALSEPLVMLFFGPDFRPAIIIMSILSMMIPLKCIGDIICYQVMVCAKKESILMKVYFVTMLINLLNNSILIPLLGASGAAIASVISEILAFILVYIYSKKYFTIERKNIVLKSIVCSLVMLTIMLIINLTNIPFLIKLVIGGTAGFIVYITISILSKNEMILYLRNTILRIKKN